MVADAVKQFVEKVHFAQLIDQVSLLIQIDVHMLTKRIIPCLDVMNGRVVKGINFKNLKDVGDPVNLAIKYYNEGADELCFLDITASMEKRKTMIKMVKDVAKNIFIPFTVGGGIKTVDDIQELLKIFCEVI